MTGMWSYLGLIPTNSANRMPPTLSSTTRTSGGLSLSALTALGPSEAVSGWNRPTSILLIKDENRSWSTIRTRFRSSGTFAVSPAESHKIAHNLIGHAGERNVGSHGCLDQLYESPILSESGEIIIVSDVGIGHEYLWHIPSARSQYGQNRRV